MITRYRAWMDGTALDEIADSIYITDIVEPETQVEVISLPLAGRSGSRLQSNHRRSKTVLIRLMIREYDVAARKDVLNKVLSWAQGEALEINDRDGLVLYVRLDNVPQISSLKWTETITLSFTAWDVPYWMLSEMLPTGFVGGVTSVSLQAPGFGNAPAYVSVAVQNTGTTAIDAMTITVAERYRIRLEGLELTQNQIVVIGHNNAGPLLIVREQSGLDSVSLMDKRTPDSDDDLRSVPGEEYISCTVDVSYAGEAQTFKALMGVRHLWL